MENTGEGDGTGNDDERSDSEGGGDATEADRKLRRATKVVPFECSVDEGPKS